MGQILTFYSYKGGAGRTMALANIAVLLAQKGKKVLIVDWDLEAPGLEYYFRDYLDIEKVSRVRGVIDLISSYSNEQRNSDDISWEDCVVSFRVMNSRLSLITSGQKKTNENESSYFSLVRSLDVDHFYEEKRGGIYIEKLRSEWKSKYDFVLIDSRTGITDLGGICTIQLPDVLVLLFNANEQSLAGIIDVAEKASQQRKKLPFDRYSLLIFPIATRFDAQAEFNISQIWLGRFAIELKDLFSNWLPKRVDIKSFIEVTKIPYTPYFSFGEKLPVIEQGVSDPASLGFSYENISSIIVDNFENVEKVLRSRGLVGGEAFIEDEASDVLQLPQKQISKDVPRNVRRLSQRGMLSISMLALSMGALTIAMLGGARLVLDIFSVGLEGSLDSIGTKAFVVGLAYLVGWLTAMVAIRVYGNLILPLLINLATWGCLVGVCVLYVLILQRLYTQGYDIAHYWAYIMIMGAGLGAMVGLHLIIEDHDLRPFSIPLLLINTIQLLLIIYRYVFNPPNDNSFLWNDLIFFFGMSAFSIFTLAHIGILEPLRMQLTSYFDRNSKTIRTRD